MRSGVRAFRAPSKDETEDLVAELVKKYRTIHGTRRETEFTEEDVRTKFINPLLEALGWDVAGLDEVRAEQRTLTGRADIALGLAPERKARIFCEVKKFDPGKDGLDSGFYRGGRWVTFPEQTVQYAWQMQVSWAVLTNFKETRLYSSYIDPRRPKEGLIFAIEWEQYLKRFDELWLISKESVASGALDAREKKRKRETIHEEAPEDLFECRGIFAGDIHRNNPELAPGQVQEAVQRILDRLIVVRVAEDRAILTSETLWTWYDAFRKTQVDEKALFAGALKQFFRQIDVIYNSKLFAPHFCEEIQVSNAAFADVLGTLYQFNFDLIDADILGSIYEGYLGHVLTTAKGQVQFERMERVRKRHGVYYTPTYVVEYIVDQTIRTLLEAARPRTPPVSSSSTPRAGAARSSSRRTTASRSSTGAAMRRRAGPRWVGGPSRSISNGHRSS